MKKFIITGFLLSVFTFSKAQIIPTVFYSPDSKIAYRLSVQNNQLVYSVDYNKIPVIRNGSGGEWKHNCSKCNYRKN